MFDAESRITIPFGQIPALVFQAAVGPSDLSLRGHHALPPASPAAEDEAPGEAIGAGLQTTGVESDLQTTRMGDVAGGAGGERLRGGRQKALISSSGMVCGCACDGLAAAPAVRVVSANKSSNSTEKGLRHCVIMFPPLQKGTPATDAWLRVERQALSAIP